MSVFVLELPPMPHYVKIQKILAMPGEHQSDWAECGLFQWLFVSRGKVSVRDDAKLWEVGERQSLLLLPGHHCGFTEPTREETVLYRVQFDFQGVYRVQGRMGSASLNWDAKANSYPLVLQQLDFHEPSRVELSLEQMMELEAEAVPSDYWRRQQRFIDFLHLLESKHTSGNVLSSVRRLADRTERYLLEHYREELTNEALAEALHFHPNYIARCMKEIYGCTPMEYLQKVRLEQAKLLLLKTEWSVAVVAERVGFNYAPYFSTCFLRYAGLTPIAYRKQHSLTDITGSNSFEKADAL